MVNPGYILDGKYEIIKEIGSGGMSVVYLARDTRLHKLWAVKQINKSDKIGSHSMWIEADLMKKLDHPLLPRIVDIVEDEVRIFIVMDYVEGASLDRMLLQEGAFCEEQVRIWAIQLCEVLDYLHGQCPPVIYRDMKPGNIMVTGDGKIKVVDLGIAREYYKDRCTDTSVLGTRGYAPPEQYCGRTDMRSDIFSLGMTLHHLLTGVDPSQGEMHVPVRKWRSEISKEMEKIIEKCVHPVPEMRYQNCRELRKDLIRSEIIAGKHGRYMQRKRYVLGGCMVAAVILLTMGILGRFRESYIKNREYEHLVMTPLAISYEERMENYEKAIDLCPGRTMAYEKILEAYEEKGTFSQSESDSFLALYYKNQIHLNENENEAADLNFKIGMMYFNYYTNSDGTNQFSERVQKAYSFFEWNYLHDIQLTDFSEQLLSDCYYEICWFYKMYVFESSTVSEVSKEDYEALLEKILKSFHELEDLTQMNAYHKLVFYHGVFLFLFDQRISLAQVGIDQQVVLDLYSEIYENVRSLSVNRDQALCLQREVADYYQDYREAILRAYQNREIRNIYNKERGEE